MGVISLNNPNNGNMGNASPMNPVSMGSPGPINWIQQASDFINSLTQLMNSINGNPILARVLGGSNQLIASGPDAKMSKNTGGSSLPPSPQQPAVNDQMIQDFFSTPEGLSKIAGAIDQIIPFTGDIKLSKLKTEIEKLSNSTEKLGVEAEKKVSKPKKKGGKPKK